VADAADADAAAVQRIYYAGCLTLLACERTNYPAISPRVYLTGAKHAHLLFSAPFYGRKKTDHFTKTGSGQS
jgi:hypothetical protein